MLLKQCKNPPFLFFFWNPSCSYARKAGYSSGQEYFNSQYLNFNIIASDSDLVLNFSFLDFRAIIINLIILGDEIFFFGNMKWLTFFLSAVCHYILTLLEEDGCAAGNGEATSSVLSWLPQGGGDFLEGERMCLPGGQLALSRKTSVMRGWLGRKTRPAGLGQQGRLRKAGREQPGSPQSLTKRRLFMPKLCNFAAENLLAWVQVWRRGCTSQGYWIHRRMLLFGEELAFSSLLATMADSCMSHVLG